jgi:hypothetical protein
MDLGNVEAFRELVDVFYARASEAGRHLVLRDYSYVDFVGVPYTAYPPRRFKLYRALPAGGISLAESRRGQNRANDFVFAPLLRVRPRNRRLYPSPREIDFGSAQKEAGRRNWTNSGGAPRSGALCGQWAMPNRTPRRHLAWKHMR